MKVSRAKIEYGMIKNGFNQKALAERANLPPQTVSNVLRTEGTSIATLGKIACALSVRPEDLLKEEP